MNTHMNTQQISAVALVLLVTTLSWAATEQPTPAQRKIAAAQAEIEKNPDNHQAHNALAMALTLRARESANPRFYDQALQSLDQSLSLSPDNFGAQKIRTWTLLGKHEFAQALEIAQTLNRKAPDDIMVYGFLVDAYVELGRYEQAEEAAQWMLDMRPGNIPGLTRAAYLRELFGDIDGAVELMTMAYQRVPAHETEHRAWTLTHLAHLSQSSGKADTADEILTQALKLFPDYHYAMAQLAKTRTAQGRFDEAADILRKHYEIAPHPENLYLIGQALERLGQHEEAWAAYKQFEQGARGEMGSADNANRDLVFYYVDHANRPDEALRIARQEIDHRQDVHTRDAYAWALYTNGQYQEARQQIEAALAVGIRDAQIFYHAGAIATRQGDTAAAQRYFKQAIDLNPPSPWAGAARNAMAALLDN